jgi:hypothetical protein
MQHRPHFRHFALALFAIAGALPVAAYADVYRCVAADGSVEMRDFPCRARDRSAQKIEIRPNVVDMKPNPDATRKLQEFDKKVAERQKVDDDRRRRLGAAADVHYQECRSYADEYQRQAAWLYSISAAVRQSAATGMDIAARKSHDAGCDNPNASP